MRTPAREVIDTIVSLTDAGDRADTDARILNAIRKALSRRGSVVVLRVKDLSYAVVSAFRNLDRVSALDIQEARRISSSRGMRMEPPFTESIPPIPLVNGSRIVLSPFGTHPIPSVVEDRVRPGAVLGDR